MLKTHILGIQEQNFETHTIIKSINTHIRGRSERKN